MSNVEAAERVISSPASGPVPVVALDAIEGAAPDKVTAQSQLREQGYTILRGVIPMASVDAVAARARELLEQPSIAGVWGYFRADYQKKVLLPTLLGKAVYDLILNETVIEIVEAYLGAECILAETNLKADRGVGYRYFPLHADFAAGWRKRADQPSRVTQDSMREPLGVGGMIYLHDTSEGAFCYCEGTHKLGAPHGQKFASYPRAMQAEIIAKKVRLDGLKGDLVLFDDRGFHGPDHPSKKSRTAILVDYYRTDILGNEQVTPLPIWSCDIGALSAKRLQVLGANSTYTRPFDHYKWNKIGNTSAYRLIVMLVESAFLWPHLKMKIKAIFGR